MSGQSGDFQGRLEKNLKSYLDPYAVGSIPAWRMPEQRRRGWRFLGGAGAALTAKIAVGGVVAVLAAGAATEAVITRSVNPADWVRQVQHQVQPGQPAQPGPAGTPATSSNPALQSPKAGASPVVPTPALPPVSAPPLPSLPVPKPSLPPIP